MDIIQGDYFIVEHVNAFLNDECSTIKESQCIYFNAFTLVTRFPAVNKVNLF